jgi:hypothetical protein
LGRAWGWAWGRTWRRKTLEGWKVLVLMKE